MPKPDNYPLWRVELWWDRSEDDPHFHMGWRTKNGINARYVTLAFNLPNKTIYEKAVTFATWVNLQEELHFRMEFSRSHLYQDIVNAKRSHYTSTAYLRQRAHLETVSTTQTDGYWARYAEESKQKKEAEDKAKQLLILSTDATFAQNVLGYYPFYFTPEPGRTYIIDPQGKNVIWLDEDCPKGLCIYLADPKVQENRYDWALAIYLYLKGAAKTLHDTANEYRYIRYAEWKKVDVNLPTAGDQHEQV